MNEQDTSYAEAWGTDETDVPLVDAVTRAKLEEKNAAHDEYVQAHADLEAAGDADPDEDAEDEDSDEIEVREAAEAAGKKGVQE